LNFDENLAKITPEKLFENQTMLKNLKIILLITFCNFANAQKIDLNWSKCIGGSQDEALGLTTLNVLGRSNTSIAVAPDSSIYMATHSRSADGFVGRNRGENDIYVVKLAPNGDTLWTRTFGGPADERLYQVITTPEGGCFLAGTTQSKTMDFQSNFNGSNAFVIKLNADGSTAFIRIYGGNGNDQIFGICNTDDGGFLIVGESNSVDGDLQQAGSSPGLAWVMKLNASGVRQWARIVQSYPGNNNGLEAFWRAAQAPDGSYIVAGYGSNNFNDPESDEIFIVKYSSSGVQQWRKLMGSPRGDGLGNIIPKPDNSGYWFVGRVSIAGNNVSVYNGGNGDVWWVELNASGDIVREKTFGGSDWEFAYDMTIDSEKRMYIAGFTRSTNGVAGSGFGLQDFWVLVVDTLGDTVATYRQGGSANDVLQGIALSPSKNWFVVSGRTDSNNTPETASNNGGRDAWVARLTLNQPEDTTVTALPMSLTNNKYQIVYAGKDRILRAIHPVRNANYAIQDATGRRLQTGKWSGSSLRLPQLKQGVYLLHLQIEDSHLHQIIRYVQ
jgi:hypothetical protein